MSYAPSYQEGTSLANITRPFAPVDLGGALVKRYVRTAGNDANDGLTPATAWATIDFAIGQVPVAFTNGAYFLDVTGISQVMSRSIPTPIGAGGFFANDPASILGFVVGSIILHSDLVVTDTVLAADNISVAFDPTTNQQIITTSGGLVPNSLQGKLVSAFGSINGVVKRNDATDIYCTGSGLGSGIQLDFSEPGATVENVKVYRALGGVWIEGIKMQATAPGSFGLEIQQCPEQPWIAACEIGTFLIDDSPAPTNMFFCTIIPSIGGNTLNSIENCTLRLQGGFAKDVFFNSSEPFENIDVSDCGFDNCGPIWGSQSLSLINGHGMCIFSEFLNPQGAAVNIFGAGTFYLQNCTINGSTGDGIVVEGPAILQLLEVPAGAGNLGVGVRLSEGAHLASDFASVLLTGASGNVSIGNLGILSWVAVNGSPNNRSSDFSANGDGSTVVAS